MVYLNERHACEATSECKTDWAVPWHVGHQHENLCSVHVKWKGSINCKSSSDIYRSKEQEQSCVRLDLIPYSYKINCICFLHFWNSPRRIWTRQSGAFDHRHGYMFIRIVPAGIRNHCAPITAHAAFVSSCSLQILGGRPRRPCFGPCACNTPCFAWCSKCWQCPPALPTCWL